MISMINILGIKSTWLGIPSRGPLFLKDSKKQFWSILYLYYLLSQGISLFVKNLINLKLPFPEIWQKKRLWFEQWL